MSSDSIRTAGKMANNVVKAIRKKIPKQLQASGGHQMGNSVQVVFDLLNDLFTGFTNVTEIPTMLAQLGTALFTTLRRDTKPIEKGIHILLIMCMLGQLSFTMLFYFLQEGCTDNDSALCKAAYIIYLARRGILLLAFSSGMISKEEAEKIENIAVNNQRFFSENDTFNQNLSLAHATVGTDEIHTHFPEPLTETQEPGQEDENNASFIIEQLQNTLPSSTTEILPEQEKEVDNEEVTLNASALV